MNYGIVQFLCDRLDDDEQRARRGYYSDTHWERFTTEAHLHAWRAWREHFPREQWGVKANDAISEAARDGIRQRITAHEADRTEHTLREIDAKRRIVALHCDERGGDPSCSSIDYPEKAGDCETLRALALPYANHPDYRAEWRP